MGEVIHGSQDRGFDAAVNMEAELYASIDGLVYPIVEWRDPDGNLTSKDQAAFGIAGRGFRWFCVHLGEFGLGTAADRYPLPPELMAKLRAAEANLAADAHPSPSSHPETQ